MPKEVRIEAQSSNSVTIQYISQLWRYLIQRPIIFVICQLKSSKRVLVSPTGKRAITKNWDLYAHWWWRRKQVSLFLHFYSGHFFKDLTCTESAKKQTKIMTFLRINHDLFCYKLKNFQVFWYLNLTSYFSLSTCYRPSFGKENIHLPYS